MKTNMSVTTIHQYIDKYPIAQNSARLIIGTIHPHSNIKLDFFYGNTCDFWDILQEAFQQRQFKTREQIITTLNQYNVAITDMIRQCDRENENITTDSKLYSLILNTEQIQKGIINSKIDTVYFTSAFGKNSAAKLFVDAFCIEKKDCEFDELTREFMLPVKYFGRQIRCIVLYSPSGMANRGISKAHSYLEKKAQIKNYSVKQFKTDFYRNKFNFFNL